MLASPETALSIFNLNWFVRNNFFVKDLIKTKGNAINAVLQTFQKSLSRKDPFVNSVDQTNKPYRINGLVLFLKQTLSYLLPRRLPSFCLSSCHIYYSFILNLSSSFLSLFPPFTFFPLKFHFSFSSLPPSVFILVLCQLPSSYLSRKVSGVWLLSKLQHYDNSDLHCSLAL